jgi:hypothetical protein
MEKVVHLFNHFNSIFYLKFFDARKTTFESNQVWLSLIGVLYRGVLILAGKVPKLPTTFV